MKNPIKSARVQRVCARHDKSYSCRSYDSQISYVCQRTGCSVAEKHSRIGRHARVGHRQCAAAERSDTYA